MDLLINAVLTCRSLIQVSQRSLNGSIKYCRIHDLLQELAIKKGNESRFLGTTPSQHGSSSSSTVSNNVRRTALHFDRKDIMENTGPNLRSLFYFGDDSPDLKKFKFLKVLNGPTIEPKGNNLRKSAQLRYIDIWQLRLNSHYGLTFLAERQFRKSMSCMRNLQTLHIIDAGILDGYLADCIWDNIKTLRHVIVESGYIVGPPSRADHLPNLLTLKNALVREEWVTKGWPKMPSMRVLKIWGLNRLPPNYGESLCTFLDGLHHLTSLSIHEYFARSLSFDSMDMSGFPWYDRLLSLEMGGQWIALAEEQIPVAVSRLSFPIHLTKLRLWGSKITEDPMPVLERLESLRLFDLYYNAYVGRELRCSAGGFPSLQILILFRLSELEEWKADVGEGAMPIFPVLKQIDLYHCPKLRLIPGLRYMTSLSKFTLYDCSPDLGQSLREDESHQIREGQFVDFSIRDP